MSERASFDFFLDAAELPPDDMPIPQGLAVARGPKLDQDGSRKRAPTRRTPKQQRSQDASTAKLLHDVEMTIAQEVDETTCIAQHKHETLASVGMQPSGNAAVLAQSSMTSIDEQSSQTIRTHGHDSLGSTTADPVSPKTTSTIAQQSFEISPATVEMSCETGTDVAVQITPPRKKRAIFSITPPRNNVTYDSTSTSKVVRDGNKITREFMQSKFTSEDQAPVSRKRMRTKGPVEYTSSVEAVEHHKARASASFQGDSTKNKTTIQAQVELQASACLAMVPYKRPAKASPPKSRSGPRPPAQRNHFFEMLRGTQLEEVVLCPTEELERGRPKRRRIPPLEFWRGEEARYERLPGSDGLTMTAVVYNTAGGDRSHQLAILDKTRMKALKDKCRG